MENETEHKDRTMRYIAYAFLGLLFLHWLDGAEVATTAPLAPIFPHWFQERQHQCGG